LIGKKYKIKREALKAITLAEHVGDAGKPICFCQHLCSTVPTNTRMFIEIPRLDIYWNWCCSVFMRENIYWTL